ncbi:DUF1549 domain-containing protein [Planctomicrobium sp. SH664]|uniref:PSD1 and planctomycete cytochrome C domain-containing protein n=1 Tax=Planctomicrobium sp. SH664 TaxID=3448125 RepID=UPI003F5BA835
MQVTRCFQIGAKGLPILLAVVISLQESKSAVGAAPFGKEIQHFLKEKCVFCHGPLKHEAGLRLDAASLILKGGESGAVVDVAQPADSLLLHRVTADESERMPPAGEGDPLTPEEVRLLRSWIEAGAPVPEGEKVLNGPEDHWAYQRPEATAPPQAADPEWNQHPIDRFVAHQHLESGLKPVGQADKWTLLRRVTLDLTGLPPTVEEMDDFQRDDSPQAYEKVVDRLLASPQYGERWGRHWMDVWRYSDWDGYKQMVRGSQRHIWRWREWIVNSLNADKGYDQMIREMIAGDELDFESAAALDATGFLARNYHNSNREIWMDAVVEHTAKAFLGMTINCARCHDHKYDPVTQADYYRFRAIFEPYDVRTDRIEGTRDLAKAGIPRVYDAHLDRPTYFFEGGDERRPKKDDPMSPGVPGFFKHDLNVTSIEVPKEVWASGLREFIEKEDLAAYAKNIAASLKALEAVKGGDLELEKAELKVEFDRALLEALTARWKADRAKYFGNVAEATLAELSRDASIKDRHSNALLARIAVLDKYLALQKVHDKRQEEDYDALVEKAEEALKTAREDLVKKESALQQDSSEYTPAAKVFPQKSTGRRAALAGWLASESNPLTARVAVNHVWLRHFGVPLVPNPVDFGLSTERPELSPLLDWLAVELMQGGSDSHPWSLKHLHRLIVTSRTYQLASHADDSYATNVKIDPETKLFWRRQPLRLEAEAIRDSVLSVAGNLDCSMGGEDLDYTAGDTVYRRSLYFRTAYEKQMLLMTLFDMASPSECYRRSPSVIPQQALALANGPLTLTQARSLAGKLTTECGSGTATDQSFVETAFERVLCRPATSKELDVCLEFLMQQSQRLTATDSLSPITGGPPQKLAPSADPHQRARENLIHVLFNHTDFVTIR